MEYCDERQPTPHSQRVRCFAPGDSGTESDRTHESAGESSIQQMPEQCGGAGSSPSEAADRADAGVQALRHSGNYNQGHRVGREDKESAVQSRQVAHRPGYRSRILDITRILIEDRTNPARRYQLFAAYICTRTDQIMDAGDK